MGSCRSFLCSDQVKTVGTVSVHGRENERLILIDSETAEQGENPILSEVPQNSAFGQFENTIAAELLRKAFISLPVASIVIQQKIIHIKNAVRTKDPPNLSEKGVLIGVPRYAGENGKKNHCIHRGILQLNTGSVLNAQIQFRKETLPTPDHSVGKVEADKVCITESAQLVECSSVPASDISDTGVFPYIAGEFGLLKGSGELFLFRDPVPVFHLIHAILPTGSSSVGIKPVSDGLQALQTVRRFPASG